MFAMMNMTYVFGYDEDSVDPDSDEMHDYLWALVRMHAFKMPMNARVKMRTVKCP